MSVYASKNTLESRFPCAIGEDRRCPESVDVSTKIVCMLWLCGAYMRIHAYVINHHYNISTCLSSIDLIMDSRTWLTYYLLHSPIAKVRFIFVWLWLPNNRGVPLVGFSPEQASPVQGAAWTFTLMLKVGKVHAGPFVEETLGQVDGKDWAMNHFRVKLPRFVLKTLANSYIHDDFNDSPLLYLKKWKDL